MAAQFPSLNSGNHSITDANGTNESRRNEARVRSVVSLYGYGDFSWHESFSSSSYYQRMTPISQREAYETVSNQPISEEPLLSQRKLFYIYARQRGLWRSVVLRGEESEDSLSKYSFYEQPIFSRTQSEVGSQFPATFLCHGTFDGDIPFEEFTRLKDYLTKKGIPLQSRTIEKSYHFFARATREEKLKLVEDITAFIEQSFRSE